MDEQPYGNVPLFRELTAEDVGDLEATEIESLCVNCHEQGITRLLLTKIPFFREIVVMSFSCEECGFTSNEVQPAGRIQDRGCRIQLNVQTKKDFNRQIVKADTASIRIPALDFEIPCGSQKGAFTTVEGVISRVIEGLEQEQPLRKALHPEVAVSIDEFIGKLKSLEPPFNLILDDPAGNSFIENPKAPEIDSALTTVMYARTVEQNKALGLLVEDPDTAESRPAEEGAETAELGGGDAEPLTDITDEVLEFPDICSNCGAPTTAKMKVVNIPHFKDVVIMATNCSTCGTKDSEVKSGAGIGEKGKRITLRMTEASMDLNRDILKSDTSRFLIPELNFELMMGTLGGKFTTLEGLLTDVKGQLMRPYALMRGGDSEEEDKGRKMKEFIEKMDEIIEGKHLVSVVLDDPAGNCYIQNVYAPETDPEMITEEYERSEQQNDDLGILHMNTENYRTEDDP